MQSKPSRWLQRAISVSGALVLAAAVAAFDSADAQRLAGYLAMAVLCAGMRVPFSGGHGDLPVWSIFVLLGIAELRPTEALLLAAATGASAAVWRTRQMAAGEMAYQGAATVLWAAGASTAFEGIKTVAPHGYLALPLLAASIVLYFLSTLTMASVVALGSRQRILPVWRGNYFRSFGFYALGATVAWCLHQVSLTWGWEPVLLALPVFYALWKAYLTFLDRLEWQRAHKEEMADIHFRTIEALAAAIEAKDDVTHDHVQRVRIYSREIAAELKLSQDQMHALRAAAILHDVGKLAFPDYIISKPGRLTPEEFEKMKIHTVVGGQIVERVGFPFEVAPMVRGHHEKWDGTGYPDGLKGDQIPIGARIIAAADCLDALASDRQYRRALPLDQAVGVIVKESGKAFDPRVADVLARRARELYDMATREIAAMKLPDRIHANVRVERGAAPDAGFESSAAAGDASSDGISILKIAEACHEAQRIYELTAELGASVTLYEALWVLAMRLRGLVPFDTVAVFLDESPGCLRCVFAQGDYAPRFEGLRIAEAGGLSGWVAAMNRPMLNGSPAVEFTGGPELDLNLHSALSIPLPGKERPTGALTLYARDKDAFGPGHLRVLMAIQQKLGAAIANARRGDASRDPEMSDALTGLPNGRALFLALDQVVRRCRDTGQSVAIITFDWAAFHRVNDLHGQFAGDRLLVEWARRIRTQCRDADLLARLGGDEFALLLPGFALDALPGKLQSLRQAAGDALESVTSSRDVVLTLGYAYFPADGESAEDLLRAADRRRTEAAAIPA